MKPNLSYNEEHIHVPSTNYFTIEKNGKKEKIGLTECRFCGKKLKYTPIQKVGDILVKRDDLFEVAGVRGGKARTCWQLSQGAKGLVTAGSRSSPQINIVAHIAKELGVPCRAHCPLGELGNELLEAQKLGALIIQHKAGYNSVIIARANEDALKTGYTNIPFGMSCSEAVKQTSEEFYSIEPYLRKIKRIVMCVGSGMSLCGVIKGAIDLGVDVPIVGIQVGADPTKRIEQYAPTFYAQKCSVEIIESKYNYDDEVSLSVGNITLDPIYEAKVVPYLKDGDLFWIVGRRNNI